MDVLEDPDRGYLINEVNYTIEFRNSIATTGVDIPSRIIDYVLAVGRRDINPLATAPVTQAAAMAFNV